MLKKRLLSIILLAACLLNNWQVVYAQPALQTTPQERYFDETGHFVTGEFLQLYNSVPNPLALYGYPITEAFVDAETGHLIQYFEKVRFELQPDDASDARVRLSPLGEYVYVPGTALQMPSSPAACRAFAGAGYQVCYSFLEFYNANGGLAHFGQPISNWELHEGRMVQYFQNARLEWHSDRQKIVAGNLGRAYFALRKENVALLNAVRNTNGNAISGILRLSVSAYPRQAVTARRGQQTIYVVVQDQRLWAISNASVTAYVRLPGGSEQAYPAGALTNEHGIATISFPFDSTQIGIAVVRIVVQRDNLKTQTSTSFRLWW